MLRKCFAELPAKIGIDRIRESVTQNAQNDIDLLFHHLAVALGECSEHLDDEREEALFFAGPTFSDESPPRPIQEASDTPSRRSDLFLKKGRRGDGSAAADHANRDAPLALGVPSCPWRRKDGSHLTHVRSVAQDNSNARGNQRCDYHAHAL